MINLDKENLYKEIKNLGETTYADWKEQRLSCKKIIALSKPFFTENEKTGYHFKLKVLVFICALQKRINIRYKGFFRKLFRFFCYFKEKNLLYKLKALVGYLSIDFDKENLELEDFDKLREFLLTEEDDDDTKQGKKVGKQELEQENTAEKEKSEEKEEKKSDNSKKIEEQKEQDEEPTSKEDLQNKQVAEFKKDGQQVVVETNVLGQVVTKEKISVVEDAPKQESTGKNIKEEPLNKQTENTTQQEKETAKVEEKDSANKIKFLDLDITAQTILEQREAKIQEESQVKLHIPPRFINENQPNITETNVQAQKQEQKHIVPILLDGDKSGGVAQSKENTEQTKETTKQKEVVKQNKATDMHNKIKVEEIENNARSKVNDTVHETLSEDEILKIIESIKNTAEIIMQQEEKKFKVYDADKHPKKQGAPKPNPIKKP